MKRSLSILAGLAVLNLTGCVSLSGYDAKTQFSCKAPDGVLCESMTGIYANAQANNLPAQRVGRDKEVSPAKAVDGSGVLTKPIYSGTPIRTAPLVLRVWFAPWEDSDGDLHDQSYVYLPVDSGRWLIEHNRRRIQDAYRPARAPQQPSSLQGGDQGGKQKGAQEKAPSVNDEPAQPLQTAEEMLKGLLRQGPGSPQQPTDQ